MQGVALAVVSEWCQNGARCCSSSRTQRPLLEETAQQIPIGREVTPKEVVGAVLFLASSQANYILGEVIVVNNVMLMD